jgi:hypothetical protein
VADLGLAAYSGEGALKTVGVDFGTWNSQHTGDTGLDGASGKSWYESDFYASLGLGFGGGTTLTTTYTAYTSPNNTFTTVKEIAVKVGVDDSAYLGKAAVKPYGSWRSNSTLISLRVRLMEAGPQGGISSSVSHRGMPVRGRRSPCRSKSGSASATTTS